MKKGDSNSITFNINQGKSAAALRGEYKKCNRKLAEFELVIQNGEPPVRRRIGNSMTQDTKDYIHLFTAMPVGGYVVLPIEMKNNIASVAGAYFTGIYSLRNHEDGKSVVWIKTKEISVESQANIDNHN